MAVLSLLLASCGLLIESVYSIGTLNIGDCNHYSDDYSVGACYPDDGFNDDETTSEMYACYNGTLVSYEYDNSNCEGNSTSSYTYSSSIWDDDYYCSASVGCDYYIMYRYADDSDCTGDALDAYREGLDGYCKNTTYYSSLDNAVVVGSQMEECSTDGYFTITYYDTDDCTGSSTSGGTFDPEFYDSFWGDGDYRLYCSKDNYWSECNYNGSISLKSINLKFLSIFTIVIITIINKL